MSHEFEILSNAVSEIRSLRRQNELMNARLEMFDNMMMLLHSSPPAITHGLAIDITYEIEKLLALKKEEGERAKHSV